MEKAYYVPDDNGNPVKADRARWERYINDPSEVMAMGREVKPGVELHTIFYSVDEGCDEGSPKVFINGIQGGRLNGTIWKYPTWEEAELDRERVARLCR